MTERGTDYPPNTNLRRVACSAGATLTGKRTASGLVVALMSVGVFACSSERPITPPRDQTQLLLLGWDLSPTVSWLGIWDTESDSFPRQIPDVGSARAIEAEVSADGKWAATMAVGEGIRLFNLETFEPAGSVTHQGLASITILSVPSKIVAMTALTPTAVYDLPTLTLDTLLPAIYRGCLDSPAGDEAIVITRSAGGPLDRTWDGVATISTDDWSIQDSFVFISPATQGPMKTVDATLSPDGGVIYVVGADEENSALFAFNLQNHTCLYRTSITTALFGSVEVAPGGSELWIPQGAPSTGQPIPSNRGYILIVDAGSGVVIDTVHTLGLREDKPNEPYPLGPMVLHPTKDLGFICSGWPLQSLIVLNTDTREVSTVLGMGPLYDISIVRR